ncbi:DUF3237 domain-containing protein [Sinomonas susongensis]|uniref:DUF3237 domain-containing protein n=1 Tax=Sinomonas susongensis TaxID=1324851 RepID=UPI001108DAF0|nr:DUF3237 domain-containing protein [Sinomonas susongensis]
MTLHPEPQAPALDYVGTLTVHIAEPIDVGPTPEGHRRIIPITGGTAAGPRLTGRVLAGGADFQTLHSRELTELEARYALETEDGAVISVDNAALRSGSPEAMGRLIRGEAVDPAEIYFRCAVRLRASAPAWDWVNRTLFVGTGERYPGSVLVHIFAMG